MKLRNVLPLVALCALVAFGLVLQGCGGSGGGGGQVMDHSFIVLKDRTGTALQVGSTEPYSPRQTCGTCHDIDSIANGYHFQQGRTNAAGTVQTADDFFTDGRTWLKSDGMYGKW